MLIQICIIFFLICDIYRTNLKVIQLILHSHGLRNPFVIRSLRFVGDNGENHTSTAIQLTENRSAACRRRHRTNKKKMLEKPVWQHPIRVDILIATLLRKCIIINDAKKRGRNRLNSASNQWFFLNYFSHLVASTHMPHRDEETVAGKWLFPPKPQSGSPPGSPQSHP